MKIQSLTQLRILCIIHSTPEYLQHKEKTKRCLLQVAGAVVDPKQFLKKDIFKSIMCSIIFLALEKDRTLEYLQRKQKTNWLQVAVAEPEKL